MNRIWIMLTVVVAATGCIPTVVPEAPLSDRHQPSGLNSKFNLDGVPFDQYVKQSRTIISKARTDLNGSNQQHVIDANAPFELVPAVGCPRGEAKPYRRGVLLTHGLTDSPYFMQYLAKFFQENCFRVMAIVLPGHGTRPGDLLDVTWEEWAKAVAYGTNALALEVDHVYLAGFSTGGTLSIYQGLRDARVKGLMLFSPAVAVTPMAFIANWHKVYSWTVQEGRWLDVMKDEDPFKYESFPKNAVDQIHLLTKEVRSQLDGNKFPLPVFIAASKDDSTVDTSATLNFFKQLSHTRSKMVLYSNRPAAAIPAEIDASRIEVVNSAIPGQKILSSAHTAIVLPPHDAHYGANGRYAYCLHYYPKEMEKYRACRSKNGNYLGELVEENLKNGVMQRLMYNPHYDSLQASMKKFVAALP